MTADLRRVSSRGLAVPLSGPVPLAIPYMTILYTFPQTSCIAPASSFSVGSTGLCICRFCPLPCYYCPCSHLRPSLHLHTQSWTSVQQPTQYLPVSNFSLSPSSLSFTTHSSCTSSDFFCPTASLERVLGFHQYPVRFPPVSLHQSCPSVSTDIQGAEPSAQVSVSPTGRRSSGWHADRLSSLALQDALGPGLLPPLCLSPLYCPDL